MDTKFTEELAVPTTYVKTTPPPVARYGHCVTHQFDWFANCNGHGLYKCALCNVVHVGEPHPDTSTGCFDDIDDRNP